MVTEKREVGNWFAEPVTYWVTTCQGAFAINEIWSFGGGLMTGTVRLGIDRSVSYSLVVRARRDGVLPLPAASRAALRCQPLTQGW